MRITTRILTLSDSVREETRLAVVADRTPAQESRLRQLQAENALKAAGQDENKQRAHRGANFHDL